MIDRKRSIHLSLLIAWRLFYGKADDTFDVDPLERGTVKTLPFFPTPSGWAYAAVSGNRKKMTRSSVLSWAWPTCTASTRRGDRAQATEADLTEAGKSW